MIFKNKHNLWTVMAYCLAILTFFVPYAVGAEDDLPYPSEKPLNIGDTKTDKDSVQENQIAPIKSLSLNHVIDAGLSYSPDLKAQSMLVKLADEEIDLARANYRPDVSASADITHRSTDTDIQNEWEGNTSQSIGLTVTQPLYRGGQTQSNVSEQDSLRDAAYYDFKTALQNKIIEIVKVYTAFYRANTALEVNENNYRLLNERLHATEVSFEVGELTRTDLSQAQSRSAQAQAQLIEAQADYETAQSDFVSVTGISGQFELGVPVIDNKLIPETLDYALQIAQDRNPELLSALKKHQASRFDIKEKEGAFWPELNLQGSFTMDRNPTGSNADRQETAIVGLNASMPLYQQGVVRNNLRQAKLTHDKEMKNLESTRRDVRNAVVKAWEKFKASETQIEARKAQQESSEIALGGVQTERQAGNRTVLDVLDANQELRDARLALIDAELQQVTSFYDFLGSIGALYQ